MEDIYLLFKADLKSTALYNTEDSSFVMKFYSAVAKSFEKIKTQINEMRLSQFSDKMTESVLSELCRIYLLPFSQNNLELREIIKLRKQNQKTIISKLDVKEYLKGYGITITIIENYNSNNVTVNVVSNKNLYPNNEIIEIIKNTLPFYLNVTVNL